MLIGEISRKTGLSRDTIRFYEKKGLIKVERSKSEWNNYKNYKEETLDRLMMIRRAKGFGFTLNEISELLDLYDMDIADCNTLTHKLEEKLREVDRKIMELKALRKGIFIKVTEAKRLCDSLPDQPNCKALINS
ncbi:MAG: MerR family DNA-binding protein [Saprospiraceae bacterium]|nr:MerR family DNA-binding protein [Saprospiraceae bacterium]